MTLHIARILVIALVQLRLCWSARHRDRFAWWPTWNVSNETSTPTPQMPAWWPEQIVLSTEVALHALTHKIARDPDIMRLLANIFHEETLVGLGDEVAVEKVSVNIEPNVANGTGSEEQTEGAAIRESNATKVNVVVTFNETKEVDFVNTRFSVAEHHLNTIGVKKAELVIAHHEDKTGKKHRLMLLIPLVVALGLVGMATLIAIAFAKW